MCGRSLLAILFLSVLLASVAAGVPQAQQTARFTYVKPGETKKGYRIEGYKIYRHGNLVYADAEAKESRLAGGVLFSDSSPSGRYAFATDGEGPHWSVLFDFQSGRHTVLDHGPIDFVAWSAAEDRAVVGESYEGEGQLWLVNLERRSARRIPAGLNGKAEQASYDYRQFRWTGDHTFEIPEDIYCSPYEESNCKERPGGKPIRRYLIRVTTDKLSVSSERLSP